MNTSIEYQTIVDENDNVIGKKERSDITPKDIFRVSSVWFVNPQGLILLGKRSENKKNDPGKITTLVKGTVTYNESYEQTAIREMDEEVGYKTDNLIPIIKLHIERPDHNFFVQYFKCLIEDDSQLKIDPNENSSTIWLSKVELRERINNNPDEFVPQAKEIFTQIINLL